MHGVTTYFVEVLPALVQAGIDLKVVFLRDPHPTARQLVERGVTPVFLSAARFDATVLFRLVAIARQERSDLVHAAGIKATLMARVAARIVGLPTIVHLHDLIEPGPIISRLQRVAALPSDTAICVSSAAAPIASRGYGVRPENVRVIHSGIRLDRFQESALGVSERIRSELGLSASSRVLLLVGRMHPVKGHRNMMLAMPAIVRECPDVVLLCAGDGPERVACETMVRDLGLNDHVLFLGQRSDVPDLLRASDVLVMPSQSEGLPIVAIEAHAAGRPVVGFDVGGIAEVVQNAVTGRVVPAGDVAALASATIDVLSDAATRAAMGRAAQLSAARFSLDTHIRALVRCYREVTATDLSSQADPSSRSARSRPR